MTSTRRFLIVLSALVLLPVVAAAATTEFRVLIDADNNTATGCTLGGMTGVEHVLVTLVRTDATSGEVVRSYRLTCVGGASFSAPIDVDESGWSVGFNPASGGMTVENRLPWSVLSANGMPTGLRLGFDASTGGSSHSALTHTNGTSIIYPPKNGKRHSVGVGPQARTFQLDGNSHDWGAITPLVNGIASGGNKAIRIIQVFAFANATDQFLYFRFDANVGSDAPFAEDDNYNRPPGQGLTVPAPGVLTNDGDPNGQPLTAMPVSPATHGDVTLNADGSFTYAPNDPASTQTDTFEYKANNGAQDSNIAKVTIKVSAVANHAPVAQNDNRSTDEDTQLNVPAPGVLDNDSDADGDALTATKLTDPSHGTVVVNSDGSFTYTPDPNYFGSDSFTYEVSDGTDSATATVTVTITSVNDAPTVNPNQNFSVDENAPVGTPVGTVTGSDVENDAITYSITGGNTGGAFAITSNGNLTVANSTALDFETTPTFNLTVTATDNGVPSASSSAIVTITIGDVNEAPVARDDANTVPEDGSLNVPAPGVLDNDTDEDGDTLTAAKISDPVNGVATVAANGAWTYTPNANFFGTDSFTYQVTDGALTSTATVSITVTAVNDTPSFTPGPNVTVAEDTPHSAAWATAISAGPANESGQNLTFNVSNNNNGLFLVQPSISPAGVLSFTPAANAHDSATVTVTLQDNGGGANTTAPVNFTITVTEVNDAPTATNDPATTPEDTPLVMAAATLATNDSAGPANESGQTLTVTGVSATSAQGGTVTLVAGTITYTPPANFFGADSFTYTVTDNGTTNGVPAPQSAIGTVNVTVTEVNDAPVATDDATGAAEDTPLVFAASTLTTNDSAGPANENTQTLTVTAVSPASAQGGTVTLVAGTITYTPPANYNGADSFTYTVTDNGTTNGVGAPLSDVGQVNITVAAVNDAPVLTVTGAVTHTEGGAATNLATAANITDVDDTNIESATIRITGNFAAGQDVLSFVNTPQITGSFVGDTLTLTGSTTLANYIAALQAVQYTNTSDTPSTLQRTITWTVSDGGPLNGISNAQNTTLDVTATNDAPVNTVPAAAQPVPEDTTLTFSFANLISIADADANPDDVQVTLNVTNGTVTLNPAATGALTSLTGDGTATVVATGTVAEINAALDGMVFNNTPNYTGAASIQIVTDDLGNNPSGNLTDTDSVAIVVNQVNDAPVLTVTGAVTHTEGGAATNLATAANITDLDDTNIDSATIQITGNFAAGQDVLSFVNTPQIIGSFVGDTLTLTGSDTLANYIAALQAVQYTNTSDTPSTLQRTITWIVNDGDLTTGASNPQTTTLDVTATNDTPVNTVPAGLVTPEDTPLVINGASIADADADPDDVQVTLNVTGGTVTLDATATGALTSLTGDGTATVVATGTVAEINAALSGMTFNPTLDSSGTASIQMVTDDLGNNPSGNLTDTDSFNITVNAQNDAPVLTVTGSPTFAENGSAVAVASAVNITDVDDTNIESATITITNFQAGDVLNFVNAAPIMGNYNGAGVLTLTGSDTKANYIAALQSITFSNASDNPPTTQRAITWVVSDGDTNSNVQNTTVDVTATNDAPVNNLPSNAQSTNEDTFLDFTGAGNTVSITDADAGSGTVDVNIVTTNGMSLLQTTTGITFSGGSNGSANYVASGTLTDLNAALLTLRFTPALNFSGIAKIQLVTDDNGNSPSPTESDDDEFNITVNAVNDAPLNAVPGTQTIDEDATLTFTGATAITISDVDATTAQVTFSTTNGTLTLGGTTGLAFTDGDGTADTTMTFSGSIADINTALNNTVFTSTLNVNGSATVTINTNDQGNTGLGGVQSDSDGITVNLTAVNDAPVNVLPSSPNVDQDTFLTMSGGNAIQITDVDAAAGAVEVALTISNGTVTLDGTTGLTFSTGDGTADAAMTFEGTLTDINAALDGMTFTPTPAYFGPASIDIDTDDQGNTGTGGAQQDTDDTLSITVNQLNQPPVNSVPGLQTFDEDTTRTFNNANGNLISISDPDAGVSAVQVTLTASDGGTLTLSGTTGLTFIPANASNDGTADALLNFQGTIADINAALNGLVLTPASNDNGAATITIVTNDLGNTGPGGAKQDTDIINLSITAVNDAPQATNLNAAESYTEDTPLNLVDIVVTDIDSANVTATLTLSDTAAGALSTATAGTTTSTYIAGTGVWTASGPVVEVNTLLSGVMFNPALDYNSNFTVATSVSDGVAAAVTGSKAFTGSAVNDAPVNTVPGTQTFDEDTTRTFSTANGNAISVADVDAAPSNLQVTLSSGAGTITLGGTTNLSVTGNGTASVQATGTIADLNAGLQGTVFTPTLNINGPQTITVLTSDLGSTGSGGTQTDSDPISLSITAINDAPVNSAPGSITVAEDTDHNFGVTVQFDDVDLTGADTVDVSLSATNGTLTLGSVVGLTFQSGTNGSSAFTVRGTESALNTALNGLKYKGNLNYFGPDTIIFTTNDRGFTGTGNILSDTDNIGVTVSPVNDAPVAVDDAWQTYGNTELRLDLAGGTTPKVSDTTPSATGAKHNDSDPVEGHAIKVVNVIGCADVLAPFDCTLASGAHLIMEEDGRFTFTPGPADATDSFQYTIEDAPPVGQGSPAQDVGQVNLTMQQMIWYVNGGAAPGGNGTSSAPLQTFTAAINGAGGAGDSDDLDDYIFVHNSTVSGGIELENGQRLLGEGVGLNPGIALNGDPVVALVAAGTKPVVNNAAGNAVTITAALPLEVRGLTLQGSINAIDLTSAGAYSGASSLTISDNTINGAGAEGIDVTAGATGTANLVIQNNAWNTGGTHTGNAVDVNVSAGTVNLNLSTNTNILSNAAGINLVRTAGALNITGFSGNTVHPNTGGVGINVNTATFDTTPGGTFQTVSGGATQVGASGGAPNGVGGSGMLLQNVAGDLSFTDLDVFADSGTALLATGTTPYTGSAGFQLTTPVGTTLSAINGAGLDLNTVTASVQVTTLASANSTVTGINLVAVPGTVNVAGGSITNANNADVSINGSNAAFTYNGTITDDLGQLVSVTNTTGGTKAFGGAITDGDDGDGGVNPTTTGSIHLASNTGATINFTGGLTVSTGANAAFLASGGGTVNVTGATNKLTSTTGTTLNFTSTTIGASNLNFRSISTNGAANGIIATATGSSGSLIVTGDGGGAANASGGHIQNTTGVGVSLTSTRASLTQLNISNTGSHGLEASSVTNFTFQDAAVFSAGNGNEEQGIKLTNTFGTSLIEDVTMDDITEDGIEIRQNTTDDATRDQITIRRLNIQDHVAGFGETGIEAQPDGASNLKVIVDDSDFTLNTNAVIAVAGSTAATHTGTFVMTIQASTFNCAASFGSGGPQFLGGGSGTVFYTVDNNQILGTKFSGLILNADDTQTTHATVTGNTITGSGATNNGRGIEMRQDANSTMHALVSGNNISQVKSDGIFIYSQDATVDDAGLELQATVLNNTASVRSDGFGAGIRVEAGTGVNFHNDVCVDVTGNTVSGTDTSPFFDTDIVLNNLDTNSTMRVKQTNAAVSSSNNGANFTTFSNGAAIVFNGGDCTDPTPAP